MLRLTELKLPLDHADDAIEAAVLKRLQIKPQDLIGCSVFRRAVDARKKSAIALIYTLDIEVRNEAAVLKRLAGDRNLSVAPDVSYRFKTRAPDDRALRPVVIGTGPCGLFAAWSWRRWAFRPIILERGKVVRERTKDTWRLWRKSVLNPESNVQFGEGGAGTFSDGKLYSQIKDPENYGRKVLTEFVKAGAPDEILYSRQAAHRHVPVGDDRGTDARRPSKRSAANIASRARSKISKSMSGRTAAGRCVGVVLADGTRIAADHVVLAVGHSARDTFQMLCDRGVAIEAKPFSIGVRIEHPQSLIDRCRYGGFAGHHAAGRGRLQARSPRQQWPLGLQLLHVPGRHGGGRGLRTGARRHQRHEPVLPQRAQRQCGHRGRHHARRLSGTSARRHRVSAPLGRTRVRRRRAKPMRRRRSASAISWRAGRSRRSARSCRPTSPACGRPISPPACRIIAVAAIREALPAFDQKIKGFAFDDAVLTGVETRTSSPIRIGRDRSYQSLNTRGLYPAGEGAGYAGGILSAGVDGIRVAEAVALDINGIDVGQGVRSRVAQ